MGYTCTFVSCGSKCFTCWCFLDFFVMICTFVVQLRMHYCSFRFLYLRTGLEDILVFWIWSDFLYVALNRSTFTLLLRECHQHIRQVVIRALLCFYHSRTTFLHLRVCVLSPLWYIHCIFRTMNPLILICHSKVFVVSNIATLSFWSKVWIFRIRSLINCDLRCMLVLHLETEHGIEWGQKC